MKLMQEYSLHNNKLNNRLVMAPLTRSRAHSESLAATELMAEYYSQRASAGLIISEGTSVSKVGNGYINVPGIYTDEQVNGWKMSTQAVQNSGGKFFAQLWHVGRISHPDLIDGLLPLAPSAINPHVKSYTKNGFTDTVTPKEMTSEDILNTINDFKKAAKNAIKAGFDGIELHAAHGYLFQQFFSKSSNTREDKYGGNIEGRSRFLFEVLDALNEVIDNSKIGIRISPLLNNACGIIMDDETQELHEYVVKRLNNYNLAYLHLSGFISDETPDNLPELLETAKHYRNLYNGTLILNKGLNRDFAEKVIEEGIVDLVAFGKLFIANPDLVERFKRKSELNIPDRSTFYTPGSIGYTDYPFLKK